MKFLFPLLLLFLLTACQTTKSVAPIEVESTIEEVVISEEPVVDVVEEEGLSNLVKDKPLKEEQAEIVTEPDYENIWLKLAEGFGAKIHLLMVNTLSNFTTTATANVRINEFINGTDFNNYSINIFNDETIEKGIINFSSIIDADLIGISTHGRQGIAHFFNGSISEDLVNHAKRPVITFKI